MTNLIEIIKLKVQELRGKLVSLIFYLACFVMSINLSIHEYFDHKFSIVFFKNIILACLPIVALSDVVLCKSLTTSSTSENELNSVSNTNNSNEILFKFYKKYIFFSVLSIPAIFVLHIALHDIFYFLVHMIDENIYANYSYYSKVLKDMGELFIATGVLVFLIRNSFVKAEAQALRKITELIYISLYAIALLLSLSI